MYIIIGEIISVNIGGEWYDAEVLSITSDGYIVYVFDLRAKRDVSARNVK